MRKFDVSVKTVNQITSVYYMLCSNLQVMLQRTKVRLVRCSTEDQAIPKRNKELKISSALVKWCLKKLI